MYCSRNCTKKKKEHGEWLVGILLLLFEQFPASDCETRFTHSFSSTASTLTWILQSVWFGQFCPHYYYTPYLVSTWFSKLRPFNYLFHIKWPSGSWQFYNEGKILNQTLCLADCVCSSQHPCRNDLPTVQSKKPRKKPCIWPQLT